MPEHSDVPLLENHRVANWEYADATARIAAVGFIASDVGKWAKQLDDGSYWELTDDSPITWAQRTGGGGTLVDDSVNNAKLANMAQSTIKGRAAGTGTGDPTDLTSAQATVIIDAMVGDSGSGGTKGLAPAPAAGDAAAGKFLKADGTYAVPATGGSGGIGDVVGPSSATDNALARFDSITGKLIQSSTVSADDNGAITVPEIAAPSTPTSGKVAVYAKSDGLLYSKDDAGVETLVSGGTAGAPSTATYITQTADGGLSNEQAMSALATGIVKNTTTTGVQSIATAADLSSPHYAVDAVGTDAYAITPTPAIAAYTDGLIVAFKAGAANTGAATLAVSGLAAKALVKSAGGLSTALDTNDIRLGQIVIAQYSSSADNFQVQSTLGNAASGGSPGGSSGDVQYNNGGAFGAAPLVREDADTVGLYDTSNTSENPSRLNLYGLKNGATFERLSIYYNTTDDRYVLDVNHNGATARDFQIRMNGTAFWQIEDSGPITAASDTASIMRVGSGTSSAPGLQFSTSPTGNSNGFTFSSGPFVNMITNAAKRLAVHDFGAMIGSASRFGWASTSLESGTAEDTALERDAAGRISITDGSVSHNLRDLKVRQHYVDQTITGTGTTGNQTIDKAAGTVNIAAAGTSVVVTNSLVSTSSIVFAVIRTADATATIKNVVPASGSFTINLGAAATAEISIGFVVINK